MEKEIYMWKETSTYGKRPIYVKRDLYIFKKTSICEKRPLHMEKDLYMWKETSAYGKRNLYVKRDLYIWKKTSICEKRPLHMEKDLYMWKETSTWWISHFTNEWVMSHTSESCHIWISQSHTNGLKLQVSFAKETYKRDDILQKRPTVWITHTRIGHVAHKWVMSSDTSHTRLYYRVAKTHRIP